MENKLLIFEQNYDIVDFQCIIHKDDLEDYIKNWTDNYIKKYPILLKYKTHFYKDGVVTVEFFHPEKYGETFFVGFDYLELNNIPVWQK